MSPFCRILLKATATASEARFSASVVQHTWRTASLSPQRVFSSTSRCGNNQSLKLNEEALDAWIQDVSSRTLTYKDEITSSKLADLFVTLPTRSHDAVQLSKSIRNIGPLHTLAFFHPHFAEKDLGSDGTDRTFCPPPPFERRMWAGGSFLFPPVLSRKRRMWRRVPGIRKNSIGRPDEAVADSRIVDVVKKGFIDIDGEPGKNPMVFVQQELTYRNLRWSRVEVVEKRTHVYLPIHIQSKIRAPRKFENLPSPLYRFSWTPTPTTLFRFSSLTWNAHRIHLDREYARDIEGYPERLVHGPLTALMMTEALRAPSELRGGASLIGAKRVAMFTYRALNPVIVGRQQHLCGALIPADHPSLNIVEEEHPEGLERSEKVFVWVEDDDGVVGMAGVVSVLA